MAVVTDLSTGIYRATERAYVMTPRDWMRRGEKPAVIYCHGSGQSALHPMSPEYFGQYKQVRAIAEAGYPVLACDLGGPSTWANDAAYAAINDAIAYAQSVWGAKAGKVVMMGTSMGGCNALAFTAQNPGKVACTVAIGPALDLAFMRSNGFQAAIDAAYGGTYSSVTHGPDHSPQRQAELGKFAGAPVAIWTGATDVTVPPSMISTFAQTVGGSALSSTIVPGGHAEQTWANVPSDDLIAFIRANA